MSKSLSTKHRLIRDTPAWQALLIESKKTDSITLNELFATDSERGRRFTASSNGIYFDYSKDHLTEQTLTHLFTLADTANLASAIEDLFDGVSVNNTENRPALHTALRASSNHANKFAIDAEKTLNKVCTFAESVRQGEVRGATDKPFRNIINLGIGGSHLGPDLVVSAFPQLHHPRLRTHFVANIDSDALSLVLEQCEADTTLFIISSKSFSTLETLTNANKARDWLRSAHIDEQDIHRHFVATTGNDTEAIAWGLASDRIFTVEDWVGGRFSLWSATGLPIALALGPNCFRQLLDGARQMDEHFRYTPFSDNLPVLHGLQAIWHINFRAYKSRAVLPYVHRLQKLPDYLQQLSMESLGKSTTKDGLAIDFATGQVIWGSEGTNGQHSFHQLLLQGTETVSVDFIATRTNHCDTSSHRHLISNCLAQSKALMEGKSHSQAHQELLAHGLSETEADKLAAHRVVPGNRPSNTLLLEELTPQCLGELLAFYEHSVYVQSVIWNINAFDQWAVELGKKMGGELFAILEDDNVNASSNDHLDSSTRTLLGGLHSPSSAPDKS